MKNIFKILLLLFVNSIFAQNNIINVYDGMPQDSPSGTYLIDINNTFSKILGTWQWGEGNKVLTFKIEKVTKYLDVKYGVYQDFIKGNYSYTIDNGNTYVVNTISQNLGIDNSEINALYSPGTINQLSFKFTFRDVVYNKSQCNAVFKFLPNSSTQVELKLTNDSRGYIYPEVAPRYDFSIPDKVILTKL
jgi:hypothetical protein